MEVNLRTYAQSHTSSGAQVDDAVVVHETQENVAREWTRNALLSKIGLTISTMGKASFNMTAGASSNPLNTRARIKDLSRETIPPRHALRRPFPGERNTLRTPSMCLMHFLSNIISELERPDLSDVKKMTLHSLRSRAEAYFLKTDRRCTESVAAFLTDVTNLLSKSGFSGLVASTEKLSSELIPTNADQIQYIALYNDDISTRVFETMIAKAIIVSPPQTIIKAAERVGSYLSSVIDAIECNSGTEQSRENGQLLVQLKKFILNEWTFENDADLATGEAALKTIKITIGNANRMDPEDIRSDLKTCLQPPINDKYRLLLVPFIATNLSYFFVNAAGVDGKTKLFPWKARSEKFLTRVIQPARSRNKNFNGSLQASKPTAVHGITLDHQPPAWTDHDMYSVAARRSMRLETRPAGKSGHPSLQEIQTLHGLPFVCDISGSVLDALHIASELRQTTNDVNVADILMLSVVNCIYTGSHSCHELLNSAYFLNGPLALGLNGLGSSSAGDDHTDFDRYFRMGIVDDDPVAIGLAIDMVKNSDFVADYQSFFANYQSQIDTAMTSTISYLRENSQFLRESRPSLAGS